MAFRTFRDIRAWQACHAFKLAIYELTSTGALARDERLRSQLQEAAAAATSNISEGFGRFDPADFARFVKIARPSLIECQNHLQDAVDRKHIHDALRVSHEEMIRGALREVAGLLDYLQSPEAKRNADRIKTRRFARREERRTPNPEP